MLSGKGVQAAVLQTVELHKDIIPNFDHLRMIVIHQGGAGLLLAFVVGTAVHMDLRTGTAGTGITHLPKIILLISQ